MQNPENTVKIRRRPIKTPDGAELVGTVFQPHSSPQAALVLNGATGVPQGYYRAFATWAASERGLVVLTYDYRDTGLSARKPMRQSRATQIDWGLRDNEAARRALHRQFPDLPIWAMGHSLGGMMLPMQEDISNISRVITVASGLVHHTDHPWPYRATAMSFWFLIGPALARVFGYIPGKLSGFGSDLPASVFWEWRRWCTTRGFFAKDIGHALPQPDWSRSKAPVRMISFTDDALIPPKCVDALSAIYASGPLRHDTLDPAKFGLNSIGHISAFHRRNAALWDQLIAQ